MPASVTRAGRGEHRPDLAPRLVLVTLAGIDHRGDIGADGGQGGDARRAPVQPDQVDRAAAIAEQHDVLIARAGEVRGIDPADRAGVVPQRQPPARPVPNPHFGRAVDRFQRDDEIATGDAGAKTGAPTEAEIAPAGPVAVGIVLDDPLAQPGDQPASETEEEGVVVIIAPGAVLEEWIPFARPCLLYTSD